jgi:endonuclease/exonuclease/phosphatase (EEP) superfamily protein YafD
MDRLGCSLRHQLHIHGWGALTYKVFPSFRGRTARLSAAKRTKHVREHGNLGSTLGMVERAQPDLLVLNEVIYEFYREELEHSLQQMGFRSIAWGLSTHYPGTSLSTLVASKEPGIPIPCVMPQRPCMGGGAGMAGLRLLDTSRAVFGVHLTYRSPALFTRQLEYIVQTAAAEQSRGQRVILGGDWNESSHTVIRAANFKSLSLISAALMEPATCPTFLPKSFRKPLDHIFIPSYWQSISSNAIEFGSDHLALAVEVRENEFTHEVNGISTVTSGT